MNEETVKKAMDLLGALAAKLGVTAEYLWSVLVKQGKYEAISDLLFCLVVALIVWRVAKWLPGFYGKMTNAEDMGEADYAARGTLMIFIVGAAFILSIVSICTIPSIISNFFNPEYFALQKVMEIIK